MADPNPIDEAGPLWRLMEDFFDSWPVKPKWVLLAALIVAAIVALLTVLSKPRKS
jgi:flagellar biosynthesis/type III secretory pathway M-ring protein FliF/YscJ